MPTLQASLLSLLLTPQAREVSLGVCRVGAAARSGGPLVLALAAT